MAEGAEPLPVTAKATEGVWDLGAGVEEPSGVWGVERSEGCRGNWGGPTRPRPVGVGASLSITGDPGKWWVVERESEGVVVAVEGRDNITRAERRAPASSVHDKEGRNAGECRRVG